MVMPIEKALGLVCKEVGVEPHPDNLTIITSMLSDEGFPVNAREAFRHFLSKRTREHYPGEFSYDLEQTLYDLSQDRQWREYRLHPSLLPELHAYRDSASLDRITREHRMQLQLPF